jgi:hypothetical protein
LAKARADALDLDKAVQELVDSQAQALAATIREAARVMAQEQAAAAQGRVRVQTLERELAAEALASLEREQQQAQDEVVIVCVTEAAVDKRSCLVCQEDVVAYNIYYCDGPGCSNTICRRGDCVDKFKGFSDRCMLCRNARLLLPP